MNKKEQKPTARPIMTITIIKNVEKKSNTRKLTISKEKKIV